MRRLQDFETIQGKIIQLEIVLELILERLNLIVDYPNKEYSKNWALREVCKECGK